MDTVQEALFKSMLNNRWFTQSDGDVEFSLGYFGYVHNHPSELKQIREEFEDVLGTYGSIADEQIVGVWWAQIRSTGVIYIEKLGDVPAEVTSMYDMSTNPAVKQAEKKFDSCVRDYEEDA